MTKKDFELIACVLKQNEKYLSEGGAAVLRLAFSDALNATNNRFNTERFLQAAKAD